MPLLSTLVACAETSPESGLRRLPLLDLSSLDPASRPLEPTENGKFAATRLNVLLAISGAFVKDEGGKWKSCNRDASDEWGLLVSKRLFCEDDTVPVR